jgi:hypothetical protein
LVSPLTRPEFLHRTTTPTIAPGGTLPRAHFEEAIGVQPDRSPAGPARFPPPTRSTEAPGCLLSGRGRAVHAFRNLDLIARLLDLSSTSHPLPQLRPAQPEQSQGRTPTNSLVLAPPSGRQAGPPTFAGGSTRFTGAGSWRPPGRSAKSLKRWRSGRHKCSACWAETASAGTRARSTRRTALCCRGRRLVIHHQ